MVCHARGLKYLYIMKKNVVVTGGAGFIGSHIVDALLLDDRVDQVLIIDNLSNGSLDNIAHHKKNPNLHFAQLDIRDFSKIKEAINGYHLLSHQAALGSVPRSIKDPITTNEVNIDGTLNVLKSAVDHHLERVVLACSSSTYGDSKDLPKVEANIGNPLSPYAVTKYVNELYADVFHKTYGLDYIGLRYFNVFGPRQSPDNPYAAVIPLFCQAMIEGKSPVINGDGQTSRDFTYVDNVVRANMKALFTDNKSALNEVYNVACGEQTSLNEMVNAINQALGTSNEARYRDERMGDIKHSLADITKIRQLLNYQPGVRFDEGIAMVLAWYNNSRH